MKLKSFIITIIFLTVTFFVVHRFLSIPVFYFHTASSYIIYPFLKAQQMLISPVKNYFERKQTYEELRLLNTLLSQQNEELRAENIKYKSMQDVAHDIRELTDFARRYETQPHSLCQILLRQFSDTAHFFLIDAGSKKGIAKDMIAVWQNTIIGRVVEVYPYYSKVLLITDRNCKVACYCASTQAAGIHEGINKDTQTSVSYVNHLLPVREDDLLLSSGEGLIFPRGFALGKIEQCHNDGTKYDIIAKPLVDLHKIQYCYVIQKGTA
jgi:rod shape-determining protein MreC